MTDFASIAAGLDATDELRTYRDRFFGTGGPGHEADAQRPGMPLAYFDGNSLGRPALASMTRIESFLRQEWGTRLIRSWDEEWMRLPFELGDKIGRAALGAAPGQTFVADSTSVILFKLARAAIDAQLARDPKRTEIVADSDNFPTDRFLLEGIAAERGLTLRWIDSDPESGVSVEQVRSVSSQRTALVLLSHVAYRSGFLADGPGITAAAHAVGAYVLWDLSHSVGSVPLELDAWGADFAAGCTYKYLCGGPGAPAFGYVATRHLDTVDQPIHGWMGAADIFSMGPRYEPGPGIVKFITGTPPVLGMLAMEPVIDMIAEVGIARVRAKSIALTELVIAFADERLETLGVRVASPRASDSRGGHVTLAHPLMRDVTAKLWAHDVIPDYRDPGGLRIGLSPLTTSFAEVIVGLEAVASTLKA
jgi:kynureninase